MYKKNNIILYQTEYRYFPIDAHDKHNYIIMHQLAVACANPMDANSSENCDKIKAHVISHGPRIVQDS